MVKNDACEVMCKLYIKKLYDHMIWLFFPGVLENIGFRTKWVEQIKQQHIIYPEKKAYIYNKVFYFD